MRQDASVVYLGACDPSLQIWLQPLFCSWGCPLSFFLIFFFVGVESGVGLLKGQGPEHTVFAMHLFIKCYPRK